MIIETDDGETYNTHTDTLSSEVAITTESVLAALPLYRPHTYISFGDLRDGLGLDITRQRELKTVLDALVAQGKAELKRGRGYRSTRLLRDQVLSQLSDPDQIGTTAYSAAWEAVEAALIALEDSGEDGDPAQTAIDEVTEVAAACFEIRRRLAPGRDPRDVARQIVSGNEEVQSILRAELANEEAMRREAMSKQRYDELPPAATLSSAIDSINQGLPIAVDGTSDDEVEALRALLQIRDLLPGGYYIANLL